MPSARPHIVLVSREVAPFGAAGGIGVYVSALSALLASLADVTVLTTDVHRQSFEACTRGDGPDAFPDGVDVQFVAEPTSALASSDYRRAYEWSARVAETLRAMCRERRVDLVEFPDWLGTACVTLQARRTRDAALRSTQVCVRAHSTVEMNAALNGYYPDDIEGLRLFDLERFSLRYADTVLWAGGDILPTYQRFYGSDGLAHARRIPHPAPSWLRRHQAGLPPSAGPLRALYVGRLERRKGIDRLIAAMREIDDDGVELTVVGDDTPTASVGTSMRESLALAAAGDARISFERPQSHSGVLELISVHHVGVLPSVWECWQTSSWSSSL